MSDTGTKTDGRVERGNQTRRLVLGRTMDIASVEGLDGLSLGRIATELQLSKSGVFALFGSKEGLQLSTIRAAAAVFAENVATPLKDVPPGARRVRELCRNWLTYSSDRVFAGGCFFYAVSAEFDARTGPVHDAVAQTRRDWNAYMETSLTEAQVVGDFAADLDVEQLAFEVIALMEAANAQSVLLGDTRAYDRAERGITARLRASATDRGRDVLDAE
ncbi:TetR/AcrR family transcriptional regulator [Streptomyces sp. NBC_00233]|uniref:TetR/AcrR family transcriptional regulator n=1 Tax=Streptomyces sp. NBC_00233 TaxID=2975686 RepID=UPI00224CFCB9|nr:TetR/AcrR family transcriptional regulator [Streptomyces sp. NBC_00233]MCX5229892.1 TetR/AcrR family transcriptional regulator [Streptomyces sp. NBC_00233]